MLELYLRVTGRVQGVGFRATARQFAGQLGLMGYAANLPDGSVEICAQGEREHLEKFLTRLQTEFAGYIGEIQVEWRTAKTVYDHFSIKLS